MNKKKTFEKDFSTEDESHFLSSEGSKSVSDNDSDFTDEDFNESDELEAELASAEKPQLPKSLGPPPNDPTRMDSATPQEEKDAKEPGVIVEVTAPFDGNNIVRKKIRTDDDV